MDEEKEIKRLGLEKYNKVCSNCGKKINIYTGSGLGISYFKKDAMLPTSTYLCIDCYRKERENK